MIRVAIFVPGSLGDRRTPNHVPAQVDLIARLAETFDITVFSLRLADGSTAPFEVGRASVLCVKTGRQDGFVREVGSLLRIARKEHRRRPFHLVHGFWGSPCGATATLMGITHRLPSLVSFQGGEAAALPLIPYGDMLRFTTRTLTRIILDRATVTTVLTEFQKSRLLAHRMPDSHVRVIPYGATPEFCSKRKKLPGKQIRILHVGNITPVKDQATLIRAFAAIRREIPAHLRIVGADHSEGAIQREAGALGIDDDIEFAGHILHEALPEEYRRADILLHASLYEGEGVVMAEAMASGTVVVSTRVGLAADLDGTAILTAEVGNAEHLASQVIRIVRDRKMYRSLQSAGLAWAREHTSAWTASRFAHLYCELVAGPPRSSVTS